jgi:hypothetical protein
MTTHVSLELGGMGPAKKKPQSASAGWGKVIGPYLQATAPGVASAHGCNSGRTTFASQCQPGNTSHKKPRPASASGPGLSLPTRVVSRLLAGTIQGWPLRVSTKSPSQTGWPGLSGFRNVNVSTRSSCPRRLFRPTAERESTATNGRRLLRSTLRHLSEVIVHAGFDDVLTLCDRRRHLYSGKSSKSRPGEPGIRPYRGVERACAKVDVVIFKLG